MITGELQVVVKRLSGERLTGSAVGLKDVMKKASAGCSSEQSSTFAR